MGYFDDDITFCPAECDRMDCQRNQKNIHDHSIPHSYFIEVPDNCPVKTKEEQQQKVSSVEYLDWYFKYDYGGADKTAVEAWNIIKNALEELRRLTKELQN